MRGAEVAAFGSWGDAEVTNPWSQSYLGGERSKRWLGEHMENGSS